MFARTNAILDFKVFIMSSPNDMNVLLISPRHQKKKKKKKIILEYGALPINMRTCMKEHTSSKIKEETTLHLILLWVSSYLHAINKSELAIH